MGLCDPARFLALPTIVTLDAELAGCGLATYATQLRAERLRAREVCFVDLYCGCGSPMSAA